MQTSLVNVGVTTHPVDDRDVVAFVARGDVVKLPHVRRRPYANVVFRAGWEWVSVEGAANAHRAEGQRRRLRPRRTPASAARTSLWLAAPTTTGTSTTG